MHDSGYAYDGHPRSAGGAATDLIGRDPAFSISGSVEAVVVAVRYVDEEGNRSRQFVEYDVRDLMTGELIPGCRLLQRTAGMDDGEDNVLRPATKRLDGRPIDRFTEARQTDGDRVLVVFVTGVRTRGVIVGVLPSAATTYGAKRENGFRRFMRHRGTSCEIQQDGQVVVTRVNQDAEQVTITISAAGDITIAGPTTRKYKLAYAGTDAIELGADPEFHALLGEFVRQVQNSNVALYNAFINYIDGHRHPTANGTSGAPLPTGVSPIPNPWVAGPIGNPYFGQAYVADPDVIAASKGTAFPLPDQPAVAAFSPMVELPAEALSQTVKLR